MLSVFAFPRYPIPCPNQRVHGGKHATIFSLAGAALVTWGWFWVDPGIQKEGTILIDEYYSDWEWSDVKLDTRLYGVQTVYNYYCLSATENAFCDASLGETSEIPSKEQLFLLRLLFRLYRQEG